VPGIPRPGIVRSFQVLDEHVNHCVTDALASGNDDVAAEKSKELLEAVHRFTRTR
jgi:DNA-binding FrmR family transcriptional regulator